MCTESLFTNIIIFYSKLGKNSEKIHCAFTDSIICYFFIITHETCNLIRLLVMDIHLLKHKYQSNIQDKRNGIESFRVNIVKAVVVSKSGEYKSTA